MFIIYYLQQCAQRKAPVHKLLIEGDFEGFRPGKGDTLRR